VDISARWIKNPTNKPKTTTTTTTKENNKKQNKLQGLTIREDKETETFLYTILDVYRF
jgi:hypothetical protein